MMRKRIVKSHPATRAPEPDEIDIAAPATVLATSEAASTPWTSPSTDSGGRKGQAGSPARAASSP
jgi:hypothetical protein